MNRFSASIFVCWISNSGSRTESHVFWFTLSIYGLQTPLLQMIYRLNLSSKREGRFLFEFSRHKDFTCWTMRAINAGAAETINIQTRGSLNGHKYNSFARCQAYSSHSKLPLYIACKSDIAYLGPLDWTVFCSSLSSKGAGLESTRGAGITPAAAV